ncbi:hypothetical protein AALA78_07590 [Lachnospiraceae bacterium 42-17]|jgi:hypothetical protein|nr:hypothetical protein [Dorea sp.]
MSQLIKTFNNGAFLEYDRGSFDDWCVYLTHPDGRREPPRDMDYFTQLKVLSDKYGIQTIYNDYVKVYELTEKQVDQQVLKAISQIASFYGGDALQVDIIFSILYMAMIAEEQKANTRLGKRIKRLGVYKLLYENKTVYEAANCMRGMGWREISNLCIERGF